MISTIFYGPMRSGKSLELINSGLYAINQGQKVLAFKPVKDTRDGPFIRSRGTEKTIPAILVEQAAHIIPVCEAQKPDTVLIDEIFLFDSGIVDVRDELADALQIKVMAAGLDKDFKRDWFVLTGHPLGPVTMQDVIADYSLQIYYSANCEVCRLPAEYTQRLIDGHPAPADAPIIEIGDNQYEPRCSKCHIIGASTHGKRK